MTTTPPIGSPSAIAGSRLAPRVRKVLADVAGFEIADADHATPFLQLGMDSLMLTQVAQRLRRTFAVAITFRQLMEDCASFDRLLAAIEAQRPPEPTEPAPSAVPTALTSGTPAPPTAEAAAGMSLDAGTVRLLVARHTALMARQVDLLARSRGHLPAPATALQPHGELQ